MKNEFTHHKHIKKKNKGKKKNLKQFNYTCTNSHPCPKLLPVKDKKLLTTQPLPHAYVYIYDKLDT